MGKLEEKVKIGTTMVEQLNVCRLKLNSKTIQKHYKIQSLREEEEVNNASIGYLEKLLLNENLLQTKLKKNLREEEKKNRLNEKSKEEQIMNIRVLQNDV